MTRRRSTVVAVVIGLLVMAGLVWLLRPTPSGTPLDPRGTDATGTAAMVRLVERLGATVEVTDAVPDGTDQVLVVLVDRLDDGQREAVRERVEEGARLVLLDPGSPLSPVEPSGQLVTDLFGAVGESPHCPLLDGYVDRVESARWTVFEPTGATTERCFPVEGGFGLLVQPQGDGEVVVTGIADALVNREIGQAHHARLAAALLQPDEVGRVTVVWDATVGGDTALLDLVPGSLRTAFWVLVVGVLLYVLARARRLGRPVAEQLPVRVPASELALSIGELLSRHEHRDAAAARLRADLRQEVAAALHVPRDTPPDVLVELLAERAGDDLDRAGLHTALVDGPVADDEALVAVTAALARVRRRLRAPAGAGGGRPGSSGPGR